MCSFQSSPWQS